jgi:hypothetical protein
MSIECTLRDERRDHMNSQLPLDMLAKTIKAWFSKAQVIALAGDNKLA